MNIVDLSGSSLLDYVLHSRLRLLERIFGEDIYSIVITGYQPDDDSIDSIPLHTSATTELPTNAARCSTVSLPAKNTTIENYGSYHRMPKYRSKLALEMYWKAKMNQSNFQKQATRFRQPTLADSCNNPPLNANGLQLIGKISSEQTIDALRAPEAQVHTTTRFPFSHGTADFKRNTSIDKVATTPVAPQRIKKTIPPTVTEDSLRCGKISLGSSKSMKNFCSIKKTSVKKKKLSIHSVPNITNTATNSYTESDALLSPRCHQVSEETHYSAGDTDNLSISSDIKQVPSASDGRPKTSSELGAPIKCRKQPNKKRNKMAQLNTTGHLAKTASAQLPNSSNAVSLMSKAGHSEVWHVKPRTTYPPNVSNTVSPILKTGHSEVRHIKTHTTARSNSSNAVSPISKTGHSEASHIKGRSVEQISNSASVLTEFSESSSYKFFNESSIRSNSLNIVWKTCSDISLPSLGDKSKALVQQSSSSLSTHLSLQHVNQVIPRDNVNSNAKNLTGSSIVASQNHDVKEEKMLGKVPSQYAGTSDTNKNIVKREVNDSKSVTLSLGYSTNQVQQHSMLAVNQPGHLYPQQSKEIFQRQSHFTGRLSARASSTTGNEAKWADSSFGKEGEVAQMTAPPVMSTATPEDSNKQLIKLQRGLNSKDLDHCGTCGLGLWKMQHSAPTFFNLTLILLTFAETNKNHYSTLTKVVDSTRTVYGLIELIKQEQDVASSTIRIYKYKSRSYNFTLSPDDTLEECGFEGSHDWYQPVDLTLYYDFDCDYYDCPILISDHYFINRKRQTTLTSS